MAGDYGLLSLHARPQPIRAPWQRANVTHQRRQRGQRGSPCLFGAWSDPGPACTVHRRPGPDQTRHHAAWASRGRAWRKSTMARRLVLVGHGALHFLAIMAPTTTAKARPHALPQVARANRCPLACLSWNSALA